MNIYEIYNQNKIFAQLQNKNYQLIWMRLTKQDNQLNHFFTTLLNALSIWDILSLQQLKEHVYTNKTICDECIDKLICFFETAAIAKPVIIFTENHFYISNPQILNFLNKTAAIENFKIIPVTKEYRFGKTLVKDTPSLVLNHRYLTPGEEILYYQNNNIILKNEEYRVLRDFTDGWPAAVEAVTHLLCITDKSIHELFIENLEKNISTWFENVLFQRYTRYELYQLFNLSLLDEFSIDFLQFLFQWEGEEFIIDLSNSPVIRHKPNTNCFYFDKHTQAYLVSKQMFISNKQREDFYTIVADWYNEKGYPIEAVKYYTKAGNHEKAIDVMCELKFPTSREIANYYINIINKLPSKLMEKHHMLHVIRCALLCTLFNYKDANTLIAKFCKDYDKGLPMSEQIQSVLGEAYLLWAHTSVGLSIDADFVLSLYKKAAALKPGGSNIFPARLNSFSDRTVINLPNPKADSFKKNLEYYIKAEPYLVTLTRGAWTGIGYLAKAEYNYFIRNLSEVETNARKSIDSALAKGQYDIACSACFLLMRLFMAKGNAIKLTEYYEMLKKFTSEAVYEDFFCMPDLADSWLNLKTGNPHKVTEWIKDESEYYKKINPWNYGRDHAIRAYYLLSIKEYNQLLAYTESSINSLGNRGFNLLNIHLLMMEAVAYYKLDNHLKALDTFENVYYWCVENNIVMLIIEFGKLIAPIAGLYRKSNRDVIPDMWLNDIEKKAGSYQVCQNNIRRQLGQKDKQKASSYNITVSEKKLLLLLSQGLTAKEIASIQGKTVSAVKSMMNRTYNKIGALSKADAVRFTIENNLEEN